MDEDQQQASEFNAGTVRDFFETDYFSSENRLNKSLTADYSFEVNVRNDATGAEQNVTVHQKLNFDYDANAIYSY